MKTEDKQRKKCKTIMCVHDDKGNPHYIFGDDFAHMALHDVFSKIDNTQTKKGKKLFEKYQDKLLKQGQH